MAETDTIAKLAEIISNDLFASFFLGPQRIVESELAL
jgi:hypothetical protein